VCVKGPDDCKKRNRNKRAGVGEGRRLQGRKKVRVRAKGRRIGRSPVICPEEGLFGAGEILGKGGKNGKGETPSLGNVLWDYP